MSGFFGAIKKNSDCTYDLFYGTDYHSHLGTRRAGLASLRANGEIARSIHSLESSYFRTRFETELGKFTGKSGIGVISDTDPQPIVLKTRIGKYAIASVARLNNMDEVEKEMLKAGGHLSELSSGNTCATELLGLVVSQGKDYVDGIELAYEKFKGSLSLLLLTEKGIIAARDFYGRTPVVIGKHADDGYAVASETCAFSNLGYESEYFLGPGEIVLLTADGYTQLRKPEKKMQFCSFLYVYYGFPASEYEDINVDNVRRRLGKLMAKNDDVDADFVSGIPDSGLGMALGYSEDSPLPYRRAIVKYTPTWPRSFTPVNEDVRGLVAKMKLIANKKLLQNRKVVFCDDSIVRGTQLRDNVNILYDYGAKEVHMRISCPPLLYACPFINFSASQSILELISRRIIAEIEGDPEKNVAAYSTFGTEQYNNLVERIRTKLNITSLKFVNIDDLVSAIGLPKDSICTHCFDNSSYGHK